MYKKILGILKQYWPFFLYILFLNFFTILRYKLIGISALAPAVICMYFFIFLIPFAFRKIRITYYLFLSFPFLIISIFHLVHWVRFDFPLTPGSIISILYSNGGEVREFLNAIPPIWYVLILFILIYYIFLFIKYKNSTLKLKYIPHLTLALFLSIFLLKSIQRKKINLEFTSFGTNVFFSDLITTIGELKKLEGYRNLKPTKFDIKREVKIPEDVAETHIVVIGESARKANWGLYGYPRKTTPHLSSVKDLIIFDDTVTAGQFTIQSLTRALRFNDDSITIMDGLKKSGYGTYWLSNQMKVGIYDTPVSAIGDRADESHYLNTGMRSRSLDERLLTRLQKILYKDKSKKKVIFLHLMGSHSEFKLRYPKSFEPFLSHPPRSDISSDNIKIANLVNEYDSTIKYTDQLLAEILNNLRQNKKDVTTLTYFSDHGITLFENDSKNVLPGNIDAKKIQMEVPLIFWGNSTYRKIFKDKYYNLNQSRNNPISLSNFESLYMSILGIKIVIEGKNQVINFTSEGKRAVSLITGETVYYEDLH